MDHGTTKLIMRTPNFEASVLQDFLPPVMRPSEDLIKLVSTSGVCFVGKRESDFGGGGNGVGEGGGSVGLIETNSSVFSI